MPTNPAAGSAGALPGTGATPEPSTSTPTTPIASTAPPPANQLPWAFIDCPLETLVTLLAHMLELLIRHNDQVPLMPDALTRFHSRAAPGISVKDYLARIVKYTNCEKIPLLSLLSYIDITCLNLPTFTLSSLTVHRFLIASICAGSKAQCDVFCTNAHYAKVGGIRPAELNALERELLKVTEWDLCCHAETLQRYYTSLIRSYGGYTQAPEPTIYPFRSFPDPATLAAAAAQPSPSPAPASSTGDAGDEDQDMEEGAPGAGRAGGSHPPSEGMVVDQSPSPSSSRGRGRRRGTTQMDVDSPEKSTRPELEEGGSPYSGASSSVPSSSRSSTRGRSRGGSSRRSGGKGKLREGDTAKGLAVEPEVTPIMAAGVTVPTAAGAGTAVVSGVTAVGAEAVNGAERETVPPPNMGHPHPPNPQFEPSVHPPRQQPIADTAQPPSHLHEHHPHHHHPGGKFFKSLGGIFRRKSLPGDDTGSITALSTSPSNSTMPPPPGTARAHTATGPVGSSGRPHAIVPSKPLGATKGTTRSTPALSTSPTSPTTTTHSHPHIPTHTHSHHDHPPASPALSHRGRATPPSPGTAKPVTPRVRTRDETSLDSPRERIVLSQAAAGEVPVLGDEVERVEVDDGKRARAP
ncbi:hypothetical protein IAT38_002576 [Cryptococcus sp. DSM 104549]